jgi:excisionase family DNA binding protein
MVVIAGDNDQEFVGRKEASRLLGVGERTITRWVDSGILTAWKTAGGNNRISRKSVDTLLLKRQKEIKASNKKTKLELLVVEDDPVLLEYYVGAIKSWGFPIQIRMAEDGFDGILQIGQEKPDLVITDLKMPGMDGFQMIHSLKAKPEFTNIQIIVVTALGTKEIVDNGGLPDDVHVFDKPAPIDQLKKLIIESRVKGTIGL